MVGEGLITDTAEWRRMADKVLRVCSSTPANVRRAVRERDQDQCTFVSQSGHRCASRKFIEFDHIEPIARGGPSTVENLRLRCRAHNHFEAERMFGDGFMHQKREASARPGALPAR